MPNQHTTAGHQMPMRCVIAYDPASGRILRAHFTRSAPPQPGAADPAETQLRSLLASDGADARLLHVEPDELKRGHRYRVQPASGALVLAAAGEPGFSASAGSTRPNAR
jgi:hypothetical protein